MKDVAYYRRLPYRRRVVPQEDGGGQRYFVAWIEELPAIEIHGDSPEEALLRLYEIFDDSIEVMLEAGDEITEPPRWPEGYRDGLHELAEYCEKAQAGGLFQRILGPRREIPRPAPVTVQELEHTAPWQTADRREYQTT